MMTVVTHVPLREGSEKEWDSLMLERMNAARSSRDGSAVSCCDRRTVG
jgi:hypothetical protein